MQKRWFVLLLHILFWLISAWALLASFSIESQDIEIQNGQETVRIIRNTVLIWQLSATVILSLLLFYANLHWLSAAKTKRATWSTILGSVSLLFLTIVLFHLLFSISILPLRPRLPNLLSWGIFLFYYATSLAYAIGQLWLRAERRQQQLEMEKSEAQLQLLRAQLHPHFLFNVLNNLLALVDQANNPALAESIDRLSQLLRYVVYESNGRDVPINREITFLKHYAELQLLRFEEGEVQFTLAVSGKMEDRYIEPGLLLPFIENAFKYGTEPEVASAIHIEFDFSMNDRWTFRISNPVFPHLIEKRHQGGLGLAAARKRLALLYPDRHQLATNVVANNFILELEIQQDESNNR